MSKNKATRKLMIQGKTCRPIKAQNSGSHGSKGLLTVANRLTRGPGTWNIDRRTRGRPPVQPGGGWGCLAVDRPPWSAEWAQVPPTSNLCKKLPPFFLKSVQGARTAATRRKTPPFAPSINMRRGAVVRMRTSTS